MTEAADAGAGLGWTPAGIADWLTARIAYYLELPAADIGPDVPLVELGMDSVYALTLCGDVEEELGIDVRPTMAWDHPTVAAIADHLHGEISR